MEMKEIEEFKKQNNNVNFTTKELIGGIWVKLEKIETRLENGEKKFSKLENTDVWHTRLIWAVYGGLVGIVYLVLELTGVL